MRFDQRKRLFHEVDECRGTVSGWFDEDGPQTWCEIDRRDGEVPHLAIQ